jgi:putative endonuclease
MASRSRTLYTGVTNNLERRVVEHQRGLVPGFTTQYRIERLVYFEVFGDIRRAIGREKQIKGWLRCKKIALIQTMNPGWADLSEGWPGTADSSRASRTADSSPALRRPQNDRRRAQNDKPTSLSP